MLKGRRFTIHDSRLPLQLMETIKTASLKPDPVSSRTNAGYNYHLSGSAIADGIYLPTHSYHPPAADLGEQPKRQDVFGISARKVYPIRQLLARRVGSYPTFSPLPTEAEGSYFLWHFLVPGFRPGAGN
jgi:hypothetical protein